MDKTNKLHIQQQPKVSTDYELLLIISWAKEPGMNAVADAHKAYNEFCNRYNKYLKRVVEVSCQRHLSTFGNEIEEMVLNNTCWLIYEKADVIARAMEAHAQMDAEFLEKKLKAYLGQMIRTEIQSYLREKLPYIKKRKDVAHEDDFDGLLATVDHRDEREAGLEQIEPLMELLLKACERLPEEDRDFMRMVFLYLKEEDLSVLMENDMEIEDVMAEMDPSRIRSRFEKNKKEMKKEKAGLDHTSTQIICEMFEILPGNLRQKKIRLIAKLKKFVEEMKKQSAVA